MTSEAIRADTIKGNIVAHQSAVIRLRNARKESQLETNLNTILKRASSLDVDLLTRRMAGERSIPTSVLYLDLGIDSVTRFRRNEFIDNPDYRLEPTDEVKLQIADALEPNFAAAADRGLFLTPCFFSLRQPCHGWEEQQIYGVVAGLDRKEPFSLVRFAQLFCGGKYVNADVFFTEDKENNLRRCNIIEPATNYARRPSFFKGMRKVLGLSSG